MRFGIRCSALAESSLPIQGSATAIHLFRIAQEAVNNAVKHGGAKEITIRLQEDGGRLVLEIQDDGVGLPAKPDPQAAGMGLHIMDYRARSVGGTLRLGAAARGGTSVSCCIPPREPEKLQA